MQMDILNYLNNFDLDIRKTGNARFMDQKVTPDVLCMISDCVINFINESGDDNTVFSSTDIWSYDYSNDNIKEVFGKTDVTNENARNEYDKFFQQPLKALAYAKILNETKVGNRINFTIANKEILEYLSIKEKNALEFLNIYLEKVLRDSGIWNIFENFFINNTKENFNELKSNYEEFIIENTPINGKTEVRRIFTKVINPLAFKRGAHGTERGHFSVDVISNDQLYYNRKNWRDVSKRKGETRREYEERNTSEREKFEQQQKAYVKYNLNKAKEIIKRLHCPTSEVSDEFNNGEATQAHHIFMQSEYPIISTFIENIILLTPTQHFTKAHPNNNTQIINKDYQLLCLLSKSISIENNLDIYSKEDFLFVIKEGLKKEFDDSISYNNLRNELTYLYNRL